jgi:hypothetical protein
MTPVVKEIAVPIGVITPLEIGMFVQVGTILKTQSMSVVGKVGRNPVQDDADAFLVQAINWIHIHELCSRLL